MIDIVVAFGVGMILGSVLGFLMTALIIVKRFGGSDEDDE